MKIEYELGDRLSRTHQCAQCGGNLNLSWDSQRKYYDLHCNNDPAHQGFKNRFTNVRRLAWEDPIPDWEELNPPKEAKTMSEPQTALALYKGKPLVGIKDAGTAVFAPPEALRLLIDFALEYQLDPRLRHVCLFFGQPYIELDGMLYMAHKTGEFLGISTKPLGPEEKTALGYVKEDIVWRAETFRKNIPMPFVAYGRITQAEVEEKTKDGQGFRNPVLRRDPHHQAEVRAIRHALRLAFPIFPPSYDETKSVAEERKE